jgi:hypothetical protein
MRVWKGGWGSGHHRLRANAFILQCYKRPISATGLQRLFDDPQEMHRVECDFFRTLEEGHGRIETRECWTTSDPEYLEYIATLADWQQSIAMVEAVRRVGGQAAAARR